MTNLLIQQGAFLEWFNIEFDEQSEKYTDFLEDLCDNWASTTTLAMEVVGAHGCLRENQECILTEEWWEKLRYLSFGQMLKDAFEQSPNYKTQIVKLFKENDKKLSYYDFFQFVEGTLGINELERWELNALENRLDKLGMAFIEFNEFLEFCDNYKIDMNGEKIEARDLESIMEEKMNVSYKNYALTDTDFF